MTGASEVTSTGRDRKVPPYFPNDCDRCVFKRRYDGAETHWCGRTGVHIEGQIRKEPDGTFTKLPHRPSPAWCPGMKEKEP